MEKLAFLEADEVRQLVAHHQTPFFVYDAATLRRRAQEVLHFPHPYGFTARFAMKALPTAAIIQLFTKEGLHIDASSGYEVERAMKAGVPAGNIQLTAQQLPDNFEELVRQGMLVSLSSLGQMERYAKAFPNTNCTVRINPGLGTGHSNRTNVGGVSSSFGIWRGHIPQVRELAAQNGLTVNGMHTHVGSGTDPEVWVHCARLSLECAALLPDVQRINLGGGYKVARMMEEHSADLADIGQRIVDELHRFHAEHGRELDLEIEPGTYLVANAGSLIARITDIVDTGPTGYTFLKTDTGMTEILRPSHYGAQHPLVVVPQSPEDREIGHYLVAGHCCESGDILTPAPGNPEGLGVRTMHEAKVGDYLVIEGAGAYCSAMASKHYNSFPECAELLRDEPGKCRVIRKRQSLEQLLENEVYDA